MSLESGTRFGTYEVLEPIGAGGMGEVYRARDTSLERDVALKVLPASVASDSARINRFEQEARTLASLNHPNIAQIHGLERSGGQTAIVMELIEGRTLADRIREGRVPPDEALAIARQVADALEAAHGAHVVHRDLKPANIKLKDDGTIKVLDFGIAKSLDPNAMSGVAPAMTTPAVTEAGVILGTAAYMSPEQARGKFVDQRTDIWAYGCLLFEMLTGQPAFGGEDVMLTLARVLDRDTDLSSIPQTISPAVRHTLKLCLEKDPRKRIADIRDVRLALEGAFETAFPGAGLPAALPGSRWKRRAATAAAFVAGGIVVGAGAWFALRPLPQPVNSFAYVIPDEQVLRRRGRAVLAVSPDGRRFAYNTEGGIYLREMGELQARLIPGTEGDSSNPVFSPDGQSLAYFDFGDNALKRIAISGGAPVEIADRVTNPWDMQWTEDNTILFGQIDGIYRVAATAGTPELVIAAIDGEFLSSPELLPGGDWVLFASAQRDDNWDDARIEAQSLTTGERIRILTGGSDPHYVPTGHLIYALGEDLLAQRFDPVTLGISGGAAPIQQGISRAGGVTDSANFSITQDGTLVYLAGVSVQARRALVWIDRNGREEPINAPQRNYQYAQLSPDGSEIALDSRDEENDIWILNLRRGNLQRLTLDPGMNRGVVWASNHRVAFTRAVGATEEVYIQAADGSGVPRQLTRDSRLGALPTDIHPDGSTLFYRPISGDDGIWVATIGDEPQEGRLLFDTPYAEVNANISPDGNWLLYQSDESGQWEIWVRPYPDIDSRRIQISDNGGTHAQWSRDGSEIFYLSLSGSAAAASRSMMAVAIDYEPEFTPGTPTRLFGGNFSVPNSTWPVYDVAEDGRFLMLQNVTAPDDATTTQVVIIQHWADALEQLVAR